MPTSAHRLFAEPSALSSTSTDRTAAELLDRTGIIAASLPQRRRTEDLPPVDKPVYTHPPVCDQDLRPKAVVIRRRTKFLLGGGAAMLLVALGWLGGGLFGKSSDVAAGYETRPAVAVDPAPQRAPQPQPAPATQAAPVTVYVPVPVPTTKAKRVPAQAKPAPKTTADDTPRIDLPQTTTAPPRRDPVQELMQPFEEMAQSLMVRYR
jgi:hypothetical protein